MVFAQWSIDGPKPDPDGSGAFVIEIAELPGFLVAAETKEEAIHLLTPALRTHLSAYAAAGRKVPEAMGLAGWIPGEIQCDNKSETMHLVGFPEMSPA
jgi:predicted RNase H-like HicB family nuclease